MRRAEADRGRRRRPAEPLERLGTMAAVKTAPARGDHRRVGHPRRHAAVAARARAARGRPRAEPAHRQAAAAADPHFRAEADNYLASLGGPLPYMQRLRADRRRRPRRTQRRLAEAYAEHGGDPAGWRRLAARWDFGDVNDLIERHNRWYPIEARLRDGPAHARLRQGRRPPYRREPLDAALDPRPFPR